MWKHKMVKEGLDLQGWNAVKENLLSEFGQGEKDYTLKEKLALLQSVGKGPYEDSQAYLVRIRCLVSLLTNNKIPTESINQLPGVNDTWVRVLFLFGLDDIEQVNTALHLAWEIRVMGHGGQIFEITRKAFLNKGQI